VVDRDRPDPGIGIARHEVVQDRRDALIYTIQDAARERRARERRHHRFRYRLDVGRPVEPRAAEHLCDALLAGARDEQRVQTWQCRRPIQRLVKERGVQAGHPRPCQGGGRRLPWPVRAHWTGRSAPARQQCRRREHLAPTRRAARLGSRLREPLISVHAAKPA
jgi:hypothetical protein